MHGTENKSGQAEKTSGWPPIGNAGGLKEKSINVTRPAFTGFAGETFSSGTLYVCS